MTASIVKTGTQGVLQASWPGRELGTHAVFHVRVGKERPQKCRSDLPLCSHLTMVSWGL